MTDQHHDVLALGDVAPILDPSAFVAAGARLIGAVELAARTSIWYNAVLRADGERISVGEDSNLQDGVLVHCDPGLPTVVGARVTVGHGAMLHGAVIGDDCLIGMRATLLNGARVGAGSLVAAGAVVREGTEIPPGSLVVGLPAAVRRSVTDEERDRIAFAWQEYVDKAHKHRDTARPV